MGITTRGGKARILEYDKHDNLLSKFENYNRIITLLIILSIVLNFVLLFCVLILFWNNPNFQLIPNVASARSVKIQNDSLLSISHQSEIFMYPLMNKWNLTFKLGYMKDHAPLKNLSGFDFIHPYVYRKELYFIYGNIAKEFSFLQKLSDKVVQKRFYPPQTKYMDYLHPVRGIPSFLQVGSNIWLYGKVFK